MPYDPRQHHRRSIRLKDYDYSNIGAYFVTVVTWQREWMFGEIVNGLMRLNPLGQLAANRFYRLPNVKTWIVMPNHVHLIIIFDPSIDQLQKDNSDNVAIPTLIQSYKSVTARQINSYRNSPGDPVWQRNYYEHIVRSWNELEHISDYILDNPRLWSEDPENQ